VRLPRLIAAIVPAIQPRAASVIVDCDHEAETPDDEEAGRDDG
jgi:hypothetical protein